MTPQELKNSILQLAIQGKLVEQRPEEGTAEELYQQIQAEKQKLIKEGKISKGKKIIPAEDNLYVIPTCWKWTKLGQVINDILVPMRDKPTVFSGHIPWCRIEDIDGKYLNGTKSGKYVSEQTVKNMNLRVNPVGTVISANSASVGAAAITTVECCTNQTFIGLVPSNGLFNEYLYYYLIANTTTLKRLGAGTTILYVSQEKYWNLDFPLPPLAEQKRIVAKIEEFLPLIDRYEKAWSRLEEFNKRFPDDMQKSILQMAIQGKLVEQRPEEGTGEELYQQIQVEKQKLIKEGKIKKEKPLPEITEEEKPFDIPYSWKWVRLGSVVNVLGGKRIPAGRKLTNENTGHVYIRVSDMKNSSVVIDNLQYVPKDIFPSISRYIINKEDVYITVAGTIGNVGTIPSVLDGANLTENADRLVFNHINQTWLVKCIQSSIVQNQIADATTKVGQPKLAIIRIQNFIIPLPPLAEQKRIVDKIEELLPLCDRLKK